MASLNDIINGSFNALPSGAASGWVSPSYQPNMLGRGQPYGADRLPPTWTPSLAAINAASPPASLPSPTYAYAPTGGGVPLPRPRPGYAPTSIDMAAINGQSPVTKVSSAMDTSQSPGWQMGDGLLSLLTGGKFQGLGGLFSMLGGQGGNAEQGGFGLGGLLGLLQGGQSTRTPGSYVNPLGYDDNPSAAAAKMGGKNAYADGNNMLMPTVSITGKSRKTYGDAGGSGKGGKGSWATGETSGSPFW